jgi:hypothetical protein
MKLTNFRRNIQYFASHAHIMRYYFRCRLFMFRIVRTCLEPEFCTYVTLFFVIFVFITTMKKIQDFRDNKLPSEVFVTEDMRSDPVLYNRNVATIEPNNWLINKRIVTFTTLAASKTDIIYFYIIILSHGAFISEVFHSNSLKCVFKYSYQFVWIQKAAELLEMDSYNDFQTHKITCAVRMNSSLVVSYFSVGLIDVRDYKNSLDKSNSIFTQRPVIYNMSQQIITGVVGIVLSLRNIDSSNLVQTTNWIEMNKAIGISKIKMFTFEYRNPYVQRIKEKFPGFVEIIDFEVNVTKICSSLTENDSNFFQVYLTVS